MLPVEHVGKFDSGSLKFEWGIRSDETVGSTFYHMPDEGHPSTLCVATQLGCEVGCRFCHAHLRDGVSNLNPDEIVSQAVSSVEYIEEEAGREDMEELQIAFMGYGEPMHNLDNVLESKARLERVFDGLDMTFNISTSGWVPGIKVLTARDPSFRLYVSLHASDDETREQLIPSHTTFPLEDIVSAAEEYYRVSGRQVTANYLLVEGVNDTQEDADKLVELLESDVFMISLSHLFNPADESLDNASEATFNRFQRMLTDAGFTAKVF